MWYTVVITLVIDVCGLLLVYTLLRDRVRRATSAAAQIAELRDEVSRLVVELNQTTERNVALLEDRVTGLSDLLAAADRKMALLQREIEKHDVGTRVYTRLAEGSARAASGSGQGDSMNPKEAMPEPAPSLSVELSEKPGRHGDSSPAAAPVSGEAALLKQDMRQRVVMLSRSGFSASLIAARVGIPLGEVELIISLERQRMSQPASRNEGQT